MNDMAGFVLATQLFSNSDLCEVCFALAGCDNVGSNTAKLCHHFGTKKAVATGDDHCAICPTGKRYR